MHTTSTKKKNPGHLSGLRVLLMFLVAVGTLLNGGIMLLEETNPMSGPSSRTTVNRHFLVPSGDLSRLVRVHFVLRTYDKRVVSTVGCLGSIFAAAEGEEWLSVSIAILDTSSSDDKREVTKRALSNAVLALQLASTRNVVAELRPWIKEGAETYGYVSSDAELSRVKSTKARPDYIIFCNGDTFYAKDFFFTARQQLQERTGMIGVNWIPTTRHQSPQDDIAAIKTCAFEHGGVDLNGVLISVQELIQFNASFKKRHTPCAQHDAAAIDRGCRAIDARPYFVADWGLFSQLIENAVSTACISSRALFLQN